MKYTSMDLEKLMGEVTAEFCKAEKTILAKNEDFQPDQKKVNGAADDKKNGAKDEKESGKENAEGGKSDDKHNAAKDESQENGDAKKEASQDKSGKPMEGESSGDKGVKDQNQQGAPKHGEGEMPESNEAHGYDNEDLSHMHSMYSSMSKPELKAHHDSIRKCMDGMSKADEMGGDMAMGMSEQGMAKSEKDASVSEISLLKSELEAVKATSDEHKKNLDAVSAFLTKFVEKTVPQGKAITSLDIIAKSSESNERPLQKSEIDAKLLAKSKESTLAKADRDAINSYYFSKNIEIVKHLLK